MNSIIDSLLILAMGVAGATLCALGRRSDWYIRQTAENVLTWNRRPVTPDAIAQVVPWLKGSLAFGMLMGVVIAILGAITLVIGVTTVLTGS
jgi:hypothetical protein